VYDLAKMMDLMITAILSHYTALQYREASVLDYTSRWRSVSKLNRGDEEQNCSTNAYLATLKTAVATKANQLDDSPYPLF
jgi:hypothetical protein